MAALDRLRHARRPTFDQYLAYLAALEPISNTRRRARPRPGGEPFDLLR